MVLSDLGRRINAAVTNLNREANLDEKAFDAMIKEICAALLSADVNVKLVKSLRRSIQSAVNFKDIPPNTTANQKKRLIQQAVFEHLVHLVDPHAEPYKLKKGRPNVIMMVGLQGAGKTTTCTKLARYYSARGYKSCLVCADTFRAGAYDQLKQNATKAKIPYYGSLTQTDPAVVAAEGVSRFKKEKFEVIIVDTSGRHRQEEALFEEMVLVQDAIKPDQTIMVLDGTIGQAAESQSAAFKKTANFGALIITKTDGGAAGGGAIAAAAATHTSIIFLGTGEHLADLERFDARSFISKLLGYGDMSGLIDHIQTISRESAGIKETQKHLAEGIFTIRDMKEQITSIMKMGPLSKIGSMIPGMSGLMQGMSDEDGSEKLKRMVYIFDSMTAKELDSDGKILLSQPSRMVRIACGSGTSVREIEELLTQHKVMASVAKNMGQQKKNMAKANSMLQGGNKQQQFAAMQKRMQSMGQGRGLPGGDMGKMMEMMQSMGLGSPGQGGMEALMNSMGGMFGGGGAGRGRGR
ncbi:signal recognition particle protein [Cladophialophora yegresii CBS 114405]|uniref:Signal recognition particle 54 kDa protein n=1 Tax=Cladophialophora yegresii CBS 114405 TaxID=1182544 RepID=W9VY36_9EURO|nr:signal recognition particle protein [Cladophialophora yegresii CBS 114405]EXJ60752.1 signal recognition particle protein [Cladophialophora yegresii CBS 114405]